MFGDPEPDIVVPVVCIVVVPVRGARELIESKLNAPPRKQRDPSTAISSSYDWRLNG